MHLEEPSSRAAAADFGGVIDAGIGLSDSITAEYSHDVLSPGLHQTAANHERLAGRQQPRLNETGIHDSLAVNCSPDTVASDPWTISANGWPDMRSSSGLSTTSVQATTEGLPGIEQARQTDDSVILDTERRKWRADGDITLTNHEADLLRHFADKCARWLDLFDAQKPISTRAVRLALRNHGLMRAILALAAKHRSRSPAACGGTESAVDNMASDSESDEWIRYYSDASRYVATALIYETYKVSEELLVTALIMSTYEILDESDGSETGAWQRHLKGMFWIQRSHDINGITGIRQATWWAWLRQDLWVAFREKRACLSLWKPAKEVRSLDQHELADWAIYLLSQAVNYSFKSREVDPTSEVDPAASFRRKSVQDDQLINTERGKLLDQMEQWKSCLGEDYTPLPISESPTNIFPPLWIHPPKFGVALQAYSFAQILITLHNPNLAGFNNYHRMQKTLAKAVETICGIAMELKDEGCQILSAQCLYAAGLCVHDESQRRVVLRLMQACESRVGWPPILTWMDDLILEWSKVDSESA